jgi:hypothetical protein
MLSIRLSKFNQNLSRIVTKAIKPKKLEMMRNLMAKVKKNQLIE